MSHSQFHCTSRAYLDMHGLIFETSICYWQDQPGRCAVSRRARRAAPLHVGRTCRARESRSRAPEGARARLAAAAERGEETAGGLGPTATNPDRRTTPRARRPAPQGGEAGRPPAPRAQRHGAVEGARASHGAAPLGGAGAGCGAPGRRAEGRARARADEGRRAGGGPCPSRGRRGDGSHGGWPGPERRARARPPERDAAGDGPLAHTQRRRRRRAAAADTERGRQAEPGRRPGSVGGRAGGTGRTPPPTGRRGAGRTAGRGRRGPPRPPRGRDWVGESKGRRGTSDTPVGSARRGARAGSHRQRPPSPGAVPRHTGKRRLAAVERTPHHRPRGGRGGRRRRRHHRRGPGKPPLSAEPAPHPRAALSPRDATGPRGRGPRGDTRVARGQGPQGRRWATESMRATRGTPATAGARARQHGGWRGRKDLRRRASAPDGPPGKHTGIPPPQTQRAAPRRLGRRPAFPAHKPSQPLPTPQPCEARPPDAGEPHATHTAVGGKAIRFSHRNRPTPTRGCTAPRAPKAAHPMATHSTRRAATRDEGGRGAARGVGAGTPGGGRRGLRIPPLQQAAAPAPDASPGPAGPSPDSEGGGAGRGRQETQRHSAPRGGAEGPACPRHERGSC